MENNSSAEQRSFGSNSQVSASKASILRWPSMLLVGGARRNSGKTRLCCSLIERYSQYYPLVGLKVTVIGKRRAPCPHGNDACGVCSSLMGKFQITEETGHPPGKDTSLMLVSGAVRVIWLRVLREHLAEGAAALFEEVGPDALCICESTSLRHAVEPGIFVMVKDKKTRTAKPSAQEVWHLVDRVVLNDGHGFDLSENTLEIRQAYWTING